MIKRIGSAVRTLIAFEELHLNVIYDIVSGGATNAMTPSINIFQLINITSSSLASVQDEPSRNLATGDSTRDKNENNDDQGAGSDQTSASSPASAPNDSHLAHRFIRDMLVNNVEQVVCDSETFVKILNTLIDLEILSNGDVKSFETCFAPEQLRSVQDITR